ncbi:hypothetical protein MSCUN_09650 [Methanosphaera cuniculi]|uniref:Uncharacterized protein n=1 Tax=Methanosphaera cuniculi TaxID=1077256 RepID=A0A2V2BQM4_9EURY|nr:hypothetical protein MSCUN_09650 [Methanosphaera cuniculi]
MVVRIITFYCNVVDVINFTQITPAKLGIDVRKDPNKLEEIILKWITHASNMIDEYTNNPKKETEIPPIYENVCLRITAHMVASAEIYKNTSMVNINEWTERYVPLRIFTQAEKDDLEPYKKSTVDYRNSEIEMLTITGNKVL